MVFGTFDILHPGHLWFFKEAKKHGDELVVIITRDTRAATEKKKPLFSESERLLMVRSIDIVDQAMLGDRAGRWKIVQELEPDVICVGYDQNVNRPEIEAQLQKLKKRPKIIKLRARAPKRLSSTKLRKKLKL